MSPLATAAAIAGTLYVLSLTLLYANGQVPAVPWSFVPFLIVVVFPLAGTLAAGQVYADRRSISRARTIPVRAGLMAAGVSMLLLVTTPLVWVVGLCLVAPFTVTRWHGGAARAVGLSIAGMAFGYGCVWNANYLLAPLADGRLMDSQLVDIDLWLAGAVGLPASSYDGIFPLVRESWAFAVFENSYMMLFPEVLLVLLLAAMSWPAKQTARWLAALFSTYALGLVVFAVAPTVGPPIYHPASFDSTFNGSLTSSVMLAMANEYRAVIQGNPLNGFGYFVALPSLHVAVAVLLQLTLRAWPVQFWVWLPVNVLLITSTVALGYHYAADLVAGLALGGLVVRMASTWLSHRRPFPEGVHA